MATLRRVGSPIWAPHPENEPQCRAFDCEADETLYGGSAGCGKTDLLIGTAATRHKKSALFRKQQTDAKAMIDRAGEVLGEFGQWIGKDRAYQTRDGREIEFGHCNRPGDEQSWQGRAHDFYGFDELAHFSEYQYIFITGWNRTADPTQRCRVVASSNPPLTAEGRWILKRWAAWLDKKHPNPAADGEVRWYAMIDGVDTEVASGEAFEHTNERGEAEIIQPRSRTFIGARLDDNPYYRRSGYRAILQALPEPMRSALLYGDFEAAVEDDPWQVIPTAWIDAAMERWEDKAPGPMTCTGVDVARGGRANTVIAPRHGEWFAPLIVIPGEKTTTGVAAAAEIARVLRDGAGAQVDVIGIGAACVDQLEQLQIPHAAMDAREASIATDRSGHLNFVNKRAEWWWTFREALDPENDSRVALPPDNELKADLAAPTWEPTPRGIKIELKEAVEARLQRSVDKGDAVVMAYPSIVLPASVRRARRGQRPPAQNRKYNPHRLRR